MKLAAKMIGSALIPVTVIVVVFGWLEVRHELRIYDEEMEHDAVLLGSAVLTMLKDHPASGRPGGLYDLLRQVNQLDEAHQITFVRLDASSAAVGGSAVPASLFQQLSAGKTVSQEVSDRGGDRGFATYIPVDSERGTSGLLEIVQSLAGRDAFRRRVVARTAFLTTSILICCALLATISGLTMVGIPVSRLKEQMVRIGQGELRTPIELKTRDELSDLARRMTEMGEQLYASQQRAEDARRARRAAEEAMRHEDRLRTLGTLASGVAHELGTPLNVIAGRTSMIESGRLSAEDQARSLSIIRAQVDQMSGIIRQLLGFARRQPGMRIRGDLVASAAEAIDLLRPMARKAGVELSLRSAEAAHPAVADQAQIQQVLTNLLVNAVQACSDGGAVQVVIDEAEATPRDRPGAGAIRCLRIAVEDDGTGISPEDLAHVFDPFFTRKEVGGGTGLGLSISQGIVRDHGGWIEVTSTPGSGSRFLVHLPLDDAPPAARA